MVEESDSKRIRCISLQRINVSNGLNKRGKRDGGLKRFHLFFFALYIYQAYWVLSTIGEPYRKFLEKADREGFQVMEGTNKMRAELEFALYDINNSNRPTEKVGWLDWIHMDIEEHAERKKREREQSVLDSLPKHMRAPKRYVPEFVPVLLTGILLTLHALVILTQHWSVAFNVWLNYTEIGAKVANERIPEDFMELHEGIEELNELMQKSKKSLGAIIYDRAMMQIIPHKLPTHVHITPSSGKDMLAPLLYLPTLGMTFEYHRRRYVYNASYQIWTKIRCHATMPTKFFDTWTGFSSMPQIIASQIRFGENVFDIKQPTFKELYKSQLLSPFTVFQLFCVILWLLDDYWQYSFFTLFMILAFEATVVFSRIKSLNALKGMGNQPRPVMVHRLGEWIMIESCNVLPGDIMSLTRYTPHHLKVGEKKKDASKDKKIIIRTRGKENEDGDVVPADVLLLRGSIVVNEASLTGESVPQVKEGLGELVEGEELSMKNQHKNHVLYAGTRMLQCKGVDAVEAEEASSREDVKKNDVGMEDTAQNKLYRRIPKPPDGGSLCFVLRTGFSSAQGKLVRMIEGSQEKVKGHERETALLLLLLFFFAVASSSYVLYHGLRNKKRSQYEILLHCILIITSVIPPELPMQMALAVNNSLMTLMKMQVFCTEPYRVPIAGKLDSCLFDKTGTLTTDELVAVGVCEANVLSFCQKQSKMDEVDDITKGLTPMTKISNEAALVLAGCHSLVLIDGEITGDPLEIAALTAMRWGIAHNTGYAVPLSETEKKQAGKKIVLSGTTISEVEVLTRHHFSSKLQRMSCVVRDVENRNVFSVSKGSPEAIGILLGEKSQIYDKFAEMLTKRGFRVIAMGYKPLSGHDQIQNAKETRSACEEKMIFAGFIAFTCRVRRDTKMVLFKLKEGGMNVAMVTGDALLTAAHVAKEVGICDVKKNEKDIITIGKNNEEHRKLLNGKKSAQKHVVGMKCKNTLKHILILEKDIYGIMFWQSYDDYSRIVDFKASEVPSLAINFDLATTGKNLAAAFEYDDGIKHFLMHFKIFARMTPDAKENVIECLHSVGILCLMCGDGANDVGALKQADVGVALLTGFGDVNVDKGEDGNKKMNKDYQVCSRTATVIMTPEHLQAIRMMPVAKIKKMIRQLGVEPNEYPQLVEKDDIVNLYHTKAREHAVSMHDQKKPIGKMKLNKSELQAKRKVDMAEKQRKITLRVQELESKGVQWAQVKAMKEFIVKEIEENKRKNAKCSNVEGQAASLAAQLEDLEIDEIPLVKLGDASIAAPFTSKMPSIQSCLDIVRQGRCTLVTSMQMYQILALNCLISSYSLSVLYLDGVKYGDVQMTAMGMLMSVSFMSVSRSKPLERLSPVKPLTSIFHPSMFISLLGQFSIHLVTMMLSVQSAKQHLPEDYEIDLDSEFKPGIVNSVVFLVSNVQQVTVFVVNLQGRPFMTGLTENKPLLWSLIATFILTFMFASESVPGLNKYFQLVPFPDENFRDFIIKILVADLLLTFSLDRFMKLLFCPHILFASIKGTSVSDIIRLCKTIGLILAIMYILLGNDEQWEELIQEEGYREDLSLTSSKVVTGDVISNPSLKIGDL